jgi:hypothetical protein
MPKRKDEAEEEEERQKGTKNQAAPDEVYLKSSGEVVLIPQKTPPSPPADKRIHRRRPLPLVPEGAADDKDDGKQ